jgi:hypothetical protein
MIEPTVENVSCLDYDEETETYTINYNDVEEVYDAYMRSPVVNTFIQYQILLRRKLAEERRHTKISRYEVLGFIYDELGESYEVTAELIQECREWVENVC